MSQNKDSAAKRKTRIVQFYNTDSGERGQPFAICATHRLKYSRRLVIENVDTECAYCKQGDPDE